MDAQAKKKAIFRAKLNAQKKDKRINSPLVRYESDQPICQVCNVVLKSESSWDAHQVSRRHNEAINNLKARAPRLRQASNAKSEAVRDTGSVDLQQTELDTSERSPKRQKTSGLPPNFFDHSDSVIKITDTATSVEPNPETSAGFRNVQRSQQITSSETKPLKGSLPEGFFDKREADVISSSTKVASEPEKNPIRMGGSQMKPVVKGALPEGFFDNKDADLLARGIKPVKPDIKDEYKEFEKSIQEDLQLVDSRMEEEEIDAAELIEEEEQLEQRSYNDMVETLKRKKMELKAARAAKRSTVPKVFKESSKDEETSSDDEDGENWTVDWRAQHL